MLQDEVLIFRDGKWVEGRSDAGAGGSVTRFADVKWYYANVIGYVRIALCLIAAFTVSGGWGWLSAALLLTSTLLDWIDGPIARRANQCSIFGSGVDWLADILAQVVIMAWLVAVRPAALPWIALATGVELTNCIFDFATTATGRYPKAPTRLRDKNWFFAILDWSMPGGAYTAFGNILWLAYPLCTLAFCLGVKTVAQWLLPLAALYIWCELAWTVFIVANWTEPARKDFDYADSAFRHLGFVSAAEREMLTAVSREADSDGPEKRIFWVNIWQRSNPQFRMPLDRGEQLDQWARGIAARHYAGEGVELDGYGLIINPRGSAAQEWHIDYAPDYSTIFIPMSELTPENTLQYAVFPNRDTKLPDPDCVDLRALAAENPWISIRQLLAPQWSLLRMDFGAVHRGISNTGAFDRLMFWISVKKGALLPPEPTLTASDREVVIQD